MFGEFIQLILVLIIFIAVLWLTYFATKKIASVNKRMYFNRNIEIIEGIPLMQGQYIFIVKAGNKFFLLGCSQKGNITYINELDGESLNLNVEKSSSFQEQLLNLMKGKRVKEDEKKQKA